MASPRTKAFATRLPVEQADKVGAATEEAETNRSDLLRRAVEYYIRRNPDDIAAFYPEGSVNQMLAEMGENYE